MSLKNLLLNEIKKRKGFVPGGILEQLAYSHGYKASTASRRLRELKESGAIKADYSKGYVRYKKQSIVAEMAELKKGKEPDTLVSKQTKLFS